MQVFQEADYCFGVGPLALRLQRVKWSNPVPFEGDTWLEVEGIVVDPGGSHKRADDRQGRTRWTDARHTPDAWHAPGVGHAGFEVADYRGLSDYAGAAGLNNVAGFDPFADISGSAALYGFENDESERRGVVRRGPGREAPKTRQVLVRACRLPAPPTRLRPRLRS